MQQVRMLAATRKSPAVCRQNIDGILAATLQVPRSVARLVSCFLVAPVSHSRVRAAEQPSHTLVEPRTLTDIAHRHGTQNRPASQRSHAVPASRQSMHTSSQGRLVRLPESRAAQPEADEGFMLHARDFCVKERSRLAGARRVRHSRCNFMEIAEVAVGPLSIVHRLRMHTVRSVHTDVQRGHAVSKWPSKAATRRGRMWERLMKYHQS